ncbi:MAG: PadR family transcriptional regulator [Thermoplasmata archaeon]
MQKNIPSGLISLLILKFMDEGPTYGYEILNKLKEKSCGHWDPSYGTVYGALNRMSKRGYIERVEKGEEDRKYYALTEEGRERLEERYEEIEDQREKSKEMILGFLNIYGYVHGGEHQKQLIEKIEEEFY